MYCRNCGQKLAEGDKFCSACGESTILASGDVEQQIDKQQEAVQNIKLPSELKQPIEEKNNASSLDFSFFNKATNGDKTKEVNEPVQPADEFDWNIHTFPGMQVEKTDEVDFKWTSEMLNAEKNRKNAESHQDKASKVVDDVSDFFAEAFNKAFDETREPEVSQPEQKDEKQPEQKVSAKVTEPETLATPEQKPKAEPLEKALFSGLDNKTDEARKQAEQIDKFFTFNKKNEEFQKLLNHEYEKIKSGNILTDEMNTAEAEAEERFASRKAEDPMEELFANEGIIKGYQPKEVTTDVLERIDAAEAEKAAREAQLAMIEQEKAKAEAEAKIKAEHEAAEKAAAEAAEKARLEAEAVEKAVAEAAEKARLEAEAAEKAAAEAAEKAAAEAAEREAARAEAEAAIKAAEEKAAAAKAEAAARLEEQEAKLRPEIQPTQVVEQNAPDQQIPDEVLFNFGAESTDAEPIQPEKTAINAQEDLQIDEGFFQQDFTVEDDKPLVIEESSFPEAHNVINEPETLEEFIQPEITPAADHISEMAKAREAYFTGHEPLEINLDQALSEPGAGSDLEQTRAFDKAAILAGMAAATKAVAKEDLAAVPDTDAPKIELPDFIGHSDDGDGQGQYTGQQGNEAQFGEPDFGLSQGSDSHSNENIVHTQVVSDEAAANFFEQVARESDLGEPEAQEVATEFQESAIPNERMFGEEQPEGLVDQGENGNIPADNDSFDFMAESDYEEETGSGKGRVVLKVLLAILIILLVIEVTSVAIRIIAPTSKAGEFINVQLNKVIHLFTGDNNQYSVLASTEDIRTTATEDKTGMIKKQSNKNKDGNIKAITYNGKLKLDPNKNYKQGDLALTQNLTDIAWYKDANNEQRYYDEEVVGTIIAYESQLVNFVNHKDKSVFSLVKENTDFYDEVKEVGKQGMNMTFNKLEIGEIREAGTSFYVWTAEAIDIEGGSQGNTEKKVYQLQAEGKSMQVIASYDA